MVTSDAKSLVVRPVQQAQNSKAPAQRLADRAAQWLVWTAVVIGPCPDALVLAAPMVVAIASGLGARNAILFSWAAAVERGSEHPRGRAILERAAGIELPAATDFTTVPGFGARAQVEGQTVLVGNTEFMATENITLQTLEAEATRLQGSGRTVVYVARGGALVGIVAIADAIRPTSKEAIARLRALGIDVVMLTGDNRVTAERIASELGINTVLAEVLPGQKAEAVRKLQGQDETVGMVGGMIDHELHQAAVRSFIEVTWNRSYRSSAHRTRREFPT